MFCIKAILGGVKCHKLWWHLVLGALLFAYSCKQANNDEGQKPTISDEITIALSGDAGIIVNKSNIIKVKESLNLTWKDIKRTAEATITTKQNREIKEWRIKDSKIAVLKDADTFEEDSVVFVFSKK